MSGLSGLNKYLVGAYEVPLAKFAACRMYWLKSSPQSCPSRMVER